MKGTTRKQLLRLLRLTTALILLVVMLAACGKNDAEETLDNLGNLDSTSASEPSEPTAAPTEEPTAPPETEPEEISVMGTVSTDLLNVRTGPSADAAIAGQLNKDARVEILEQTTVEGMNWGRTEVGWIRMDYITLDTTTGTEEPEKEPDPTTAPEKEPDSSASGTKGTITASSLYIRKGAGTSYETVGKYSKGDSVTILETKDNWGRTSKGWISLKYVDLDGASDDKKDETDDTEASTLVTDGKTTVLGYVVIDVDALYVRYGPGTKYDVVDRVYDDEKVAYYQEKNGWARIKNGWISLAYTDKADASDNKDDDKSEGTLVTDKSTKVLGYAVVNTGALNTRYGPGTSHDIKDKVYAGERLAYYQKDGNWVRTEEGWISLSYCYVEGQNGEKTGSGVITGDNLNVRKGPGTGYDSVKKLNKGDKVTILEQVTVGKTTWAYIGDGWVSMDYVDVN